MNHDSAPQVPTTALWLTWEDQPRNYSTARLLNMELVKIEFSGSRWTRIPRQAFRSIMLLFKTKPDILVTQNPSIFLCLLALSLRPLLGYTLVVDEHNAGLFPAEGRFVFLNWIARAIARNANAIIVTNDVLEQLTRKWGAYALVLPDPLPNLEKFTHITTKSPTLSFFLVSSWSDDEPYDEVIHAFKEFSSETDARLYISGRPPKSISDKLSSERNITLTGFVPRDEFYRIYADCDAAIILTKRDNCMNCGAYEAVALEKPGILSNKKVLRDYFCSGFLFTENNTSAIKQSMICLHENIDMLREEVRTLKKKISHEEKYTAENVKKKLVEIISKKPELKAR